MLAVRCVFGYASRLYLTYNRFFTIHLNPHFDGDFFSPYMQYIQHFLGLLVVILCLGFASLLLTTELFPMETWRRNILVGVFIFYATYRGLRVYNGFKKQLKDGQDEQ